MLCLMHNNNKTTGGGFSLTLTNLNTGGVVLFYKLIYKSRNCETA